MTMSAFLITVRQCYTLHLLTSSPSSQSESVQPIWHDSRKQMSTDHPSVPGTVLGTEDAAVREATKSLRSGSFHLAGRQMVNPGTNKKGPRMW